MRHMTYFEFIQDTFGFRTCKLLKDFIKLSRLNIKLRLRIRFLKTCIKLDLFPQHLKGFISRKLSLYERSSTLKLNRLNYMCARKILTLELRDAYKHLQTVNIEIFNTCKDISKALPISLESGFFCRQESNNNRFWQTEKTRLDKKIHWLSNKHNAYEKKNIRPIVYSLRTSIPTTTDVSSIKPSFITEISPDHIIHTPPNEEIYKIHISPEQFDCESDFESIRKE